MKVIIATAPREFVTGLSVIVANLKEHVDAFGAMVTRQSAFLKPKALREAQKHAEALYKTLRKYEQKLPEPPEDEHAKRKSLAAHTAPGGELKPWQDAQDLWGSYHSILDYLDNGIDTMTLADLMRRQNAGDFRFYLLRVLASCGFQPMTPEEIAKSKAAEAIAANAANVETTSKPS